MFPSIKLNAVQILHDSLGMDASSGVMACTLDPSQNLIHQNQMLKDLVIVITNLITDRYGDRNFQNYPRSLTDNVSYDA